MSRGSRRAGCWGFSLVELLVVLAIIAVLVSLLLPAVARARRSGDALRCAAQLRQIGVALNNYAVGHRGYLPTISFWHVYPDGTSPEDDPGLGWSEKLISYLGATPVSDVYNCPSFPAEQPFNYFLSMRWASRQTGVEKGYVMLSQIRLSSQFVLSGDCTQANLYPAPFGVRTDKSTVDCDKDDVTQKGVVFLGEAGGINIHPGGNNILFADGHVTAYLKHDEHSITYHPTKPLSWEQVLTE